MDLLCPDTCTTLVVLFDPHTATGVVLLTVSIIILLHM
jgi:hypothetical protein